MTCESTSLRCGFPVAGAWFPHAGSCRDLGLAVQGLARRAVSAAAGPGSLVAAVRAQLRHRRAQQRLLPTSVQRDVRRLAREDPGRLRDGRQGQPLPDPRAPAAGAGRAGEPADDRGRRARRPAGTRAAAAAADHAGRRGAARRLPGVLPARRTGRRRAAARLVVDRRDPGRPGGPRRRAVLGGPRQPADHPAVAHRRLGLRAVPRGRRAAVAEVRPDGAAELGRAHHRHLGRRCGRLRLLQQRPRRRGRARCRDLRRQRRAARPVGYQSQVCA